MLGPAELIFVSALADRMSVSKEFVRLFARIGEFTKTHVVLRKSSPKTGN